MFAVDFVINERFRHNFSMRLQKNIHSWILHSKYCKTNVCLADYHNHIIQATLAQNYQ